MAKQIVWTKQVLENFIEQAMLTEDEIFIMETRIKGWTVTMQAMELKRSESSVHRMINVLKRKYDKVQKENPDMFPVRRSSAKETYMDTH